MNERKKEKKECKCLGHAVPEMRLQGPGCQNKQRRKRRNTEITADKHRP